ncbi:AMP-binding protein [Bordetella bronchiseptica]|uniref:AMP-binding protein n=1 Tax=Bordetella bronchiseptica TaxID=518 RepID=UPI000460F692|nr:AMP-binding protein [Bordetella bronchiseptica]KDD25568.1 AMP-binding enzyme [Bordetella bronchiseptica MBORD782]VTQ91145.1 Long-chain-fatty-acid--CoA ligase FadD15 [Bordetella bronchiseptica]
MKPADFIAALNAPARARQPALRGLAGTWTYGELSGHVQAWTRTLAAHSPRVVATLLDNGPQWIALDLACMSLGVAHLPLPLFFTPGQRLAALQAAGADFLICPAAALPVLLPLPEAGPSRALPADLVLQPLRIPPADLPAGTAKITFTSGSTGQPKGVCMSGAQMLAVGSGLARATQRLHIGVHLCVLPLPVLLENVAGVYAPLIEGAAIDVPPLAATGLRGSSSFDPPRFHAALQAARPNSVIVLPQMLRAYAQWLAATGTSVTAPLSLMAVGGAAVGAPLLQAARRLGLPAYEGYGLSEGASVQCLNLPGADQPGSAGRALPHARIRIAADGEIEISGSPFLGYLGHPPPTGSWWATGDLGRLDAAGFLHVEGRKKNVLITSFGRNVSPEWVELELAGKPAIGHAVVLGENQPVLGAVIWPQGQRSDDEIAAAIASVNETLPDYARIGLWMRGRADFSAQSGLATPNGRPVRAAILQRHADMFQTSAHALQV